MGYEPERKVYVLEFQNHPGLEVKAVSVSTGVFLEIAALADTAKVDIGLMRSLFAAFAEQSLRSWNLEMDGESVPATLDGLLTQEFEFVFEIIESWMDAVTGVSTPLATPSSDGAPSPVVSLPMEPLSVNRAS